MKNKMMNYYILIVTIIILFVSVGYSVSESKLSIDNSLINVRVDKNVRITSVDTYNLVNNAEVILKDYNINKIYLDIIMPNNNSEIEFRVGVKNYGNVEIGISNISINEEYKDILIVESNSINDKIRDENNNCENDVNGCKLNIDGYIYLTLKYNDSVVSNETNIFNNIILSVNFEEAYDVELIGFNNLNLTSKDLVAIKNTEYNIIIDSLDVDEEISIIMNGINVYDYKLENNILKIPNVNGKIVITKNKIEGTYYNITYENIINNNYPTRIREGNNLIIEFITDIPQTIYVENSNNYSYDNNILTINNITSDIVVTSLDNIDFPLIPDDNSNIITIEAGGITQDNPVNVNELLTMTFDGQNISNKIINQIDVILTYSSSTGSNQSIECILTVNDKTYTQIISLRGKQNNQIVKVSFTNLSINQYEKFYVNNNVDKITNGNIEISSNTITAYFSEN